MTTPLTDFWGDAADLAALIVPGIVDTVDFDTDATAFTDIEINPNYATVANGASATAGTQSSGAGAAIDEDDATAWVGDTAADGEWVRIDLGSVRSINILRLVQGATPHVDQSSEVLIEYSTNGTSWSSLGAFVGIPDPIDPGGSISARYWRFTDISGSFWHPTSGWAVYSIEIGLVAPVDPTDPTFSSPYVDDPSRVGWHTGWAKIDYSGIGAATPVINLDVSSSDVLMILWELVGGTFIEYDRVRMGMLDETLYAGVFYVEISFRGSWQGPPFTVVGSFTSDTAGATSGPPPGPDSWAFDAVVRSQPRGLFDLEAIIGRAFHLDAWVVPNRAFPLNAVVRRPATGGFGLDAEVSLTTPTVFLFDAWILKLQQGSFALKAYSIPTPDRAGEFDLAAFVVGTRAAFALDAQISAPAGHSGSWMFGADVSATYRRAAFSVAAVARAVASGRFDLEAMVSLVPTAGSFGLSARVAGRIPLAAFVSRPFTLDAEIRNPAQEFGLSSWVGRTGFGWFAFDAMVANGAFSFDAIARATRGDIIPFIASVIRRTNHTFGLNAQIAGSFVLQAYVQPSFRLSAEVRSDSGQKYWPPGSGGGGNPGPVDGGTGQPWLPPHHQARIQVLIDDVDMTKHVELTGCAFGQAAGNSPGTFSLPLRGVFLKYDGGEEIKVLIDGFRQFGGIVVNANHGYHYPYVAGEDVGDQPNQQPVTLLAGVDFNVLFDRVTVYNVPWVLKHGPQGDYQPIDPLPKDLTDQAYIQTVFANYIDTPWKSLFGYSTYVEAATVHPSPETPFTVETGQSLRQFLQALSQMTNQIWYLDPYYELHSHSRANANAPRAVTDGTGDDSGGDPTGGIHCRDLTVVWSIENMADDTFVYGTLASTVEGEIILNRRQDQANIDTYGLWQFSEVRSDLHVPAHVAQRGYALQVRSNRRIHRATCRIFEKGFQAGQVVSLFSGEFSVAENIPIVQLTMTFLLAQGNDDPEDGPFYGIPAYDLVMSNEPDPPWDLYDALPWISKDFSFPAGAATGFPVWRMPHTQLRNSGPGPQIGPCDGWVRIWRPDCGSTNTTTVFHHAIGGTSTALSIQTPRISPPPWCVTLALGDPWFDGPYSHLDQDADGNSILSVVAPALVLRGGAVMAERNLGVIEGPVFVRVAVTQDQTNAKVWRQGTVEPSWQVQAVTPAPALGVFAEIDYSMPLSDRLSVQGPPGFEMAVSGNPGWGWVWFAPYAPDTYPGEVNQVFLASYDEDTSWTSTYYPGGSRPSGVVDGAGGNVLDAATGAGGAFPREPHGVVDPIDPRWVNYPDVTLHGLSWGRSYSPSSVQGNMDEPRMLADIHQWISFKAPLGATSASIEADCYVSAPPGEPYPSGEGGLMFEVWKSDYRGTIPDGSDPNHTVLVAGSVLDYDPGDVLFHSYRLEASFSIADGRAQIGGKITNGWSELMGSHGPSDLIPNGLVRKLNLRITNVRLKFNWAPFPCGNDLLLGDCFDSSDDPYWEVGWGSEMTAVATSGLFVARLPVAPASLSVFLHGKLLTPGTDYTSLDEIGHQRYQLVKPGPRCVRLTYLANTATVVTDPRNTRTGFGDVTPDRTTRPGPRGVGQ